MGNVDRWATQYGLDPALVGMMKQAYQKTATTQWKPPQEALTIARQAARTEARESSSPPTDFAAPVFRGRNTRYIVRSPMNVASPRGSLSANVMTIGTDDTAATVASWYRSALQQSGWKMVQTDAGRLQQNLASNPQVAALLPGGSIPTKTSIMDYPALAARVGVVAAETIVATKEQMFCSIDIKQSSRTRRTIVNVGVSRQ